MKIYNFSRVLAIPFAVVFGFILYKSFTDLYFDATIWMIPAGLILIIIYVFSPQLDHWWQTKYPVGIDSELQAMLATNYPYYRKLIPELKERFDNRLSIFMHSKEFFAMGSEKKNLPYDVKAMIAFVPIQMTMAKEDYMFGDFDRMVVYKHPFPTPRFPFLHAMETEVEDGVIILSLQHLGLAVREPKRYYNVAYHAFAEAYIKLFPLTDWPVIDQVDWSTLEKISNFPKDALLESLGFKDLDFLPVLVNYYFVFPEAFAQYLPEIKASFDGIFFSA